MQCESVHTLRAMAIGAVAVGALASGALAIGRLAIGRPRIRSLEIDELIVRKLDVPNLRREGKEDFMAETVSRPAAKTGMLIRRPVAEVFDAIVDPAITSQFWFTKGSGRLEAGKQVQWDWEMYGVSAKVTAKVIEPNRRIVIEWPGYSGPTTVEWTFTPHTDAATFVSVTEAGFAGEPDELLKYVADSTQGFSLMLAGLKALLEHNVRLNLTADRYPKGLHHSCAGAEDGSPS
jgi:uncharacterized protein YndB with AHSA1/START domain